MQKNMQSFISGLLAVVMTFVMIGLNPTMVTGVLAESSQVVVYDMQSCHTLSSVVTITVNGINVPVTKFTDYDFTEFEFSGTVEIKMTFKENVQTYSVSPLAKGIEATVDGKTLTFSITESQYMIVKVNSIKEIVVIADDIETNAPLATGENIYNIVTDYNAETTGTLSAVEALNTAITDANLAGGGIVYVPSGLYMIDGNIILKSNVHLYLAPGSVLRSVADRGNYVITSYKDSLSKDVTWMFYNELGADNIKIYGRGMIDANGYDMLHGSAQLLNTVLYLRQATNIVVDGITVFNGNFWTVEPKLCYNAEFTNLKVINAFTGFTENDAIDVCESKKVLVQHMFAASEDDTYSTKCYTATGKINKSSIGIVETDVYTTLEGNLDMTLDDVTFDDCLGWTHCGTFKVGDGSQYTQSNVTFKNSYSYKCMQAIKINRYYGNADYVNIVYDNIDIESYGGRSSTDRRWVLINTQSNSSTTSENPGLVDGLIIKNINIRDIGSQASTLTGGNNAYVRKLVFENIKVPYMDEYASTLEEMNITDTNSQGKQDYTILPLDNSGRSNINLALASNGAVATAKSSKATDRDASKAIDGDSSTNWCANENDDTTFLQIDFGKIVTFNQVKLNWNAITNCSKAFDIKYSSNGIDWTVAKSVTNNTASNITDVSFPSVSARYIRFCNVIGHTYPPCLTEFEVFYGIDTAKLDAAVRLTYKNYPESILKDFTTSTVQHYKTVLADAKAVLSGTSETTASNALSALNAAIMLLIKREKPDSKYNLALGKNVSVSGVQNEGSQAYKAVDGSNSSCWRSQTTSVGGPFWIYVDFGTNKDFDMVCLSWEDCFATRYEILYSDDQNNWSYASVDGETVITNTKKQTQTIYLDDVYNARYVKMNCLDKASDYGVGVYEFEIYNIASVDEDTDEVEDGEIVYGDPNVNIARSTVNCYVSGEQNANSAKNKAYDGSKGSCWRSQTSGAPFWIALDFAKTIAFDKVVISWEDTYATAYTIQISDDYVTWTDVSSNGKYAFTNNSKSTQTIQLDSQAKARFVRVYITAKSNNTYGVGIYELELYNTYVMPDQPTKGNIAFGKSVTASSTDSNNPASNITDGDSTTRWSRAAANKFEEQTVTIDLGGEYTFNIAIVKWHYNNNTPAIYKMQYSADGNTWTDIVTNVIPDTDNLEDYINTAGTTLTDSLSRDEFTPVTGSKFRIVMSCNSATNYLSIDEIELYSTAAIEVDTIITDAEENIALGKTASVTLENGTDDEKQPANYMLDGSTTTRWERNDKTKKKVLTIDLGQSYVFDTLVIKWDSFQNVPGSYEMQYSLDGQTWINLYSKSGLVCSETSPDFGDYIDDNHNTVKGSLTDITFDNAITARYFRMYMTHNSKKDWLSIRELELYNREHIFAEPAKTVAQIRINATNNNLTDIRLISAIDNIYYSAIGFEITVSNNQTHKSNTRLFIDNHAYSIISTNGDILTAADFEIPNGYMFALLIEEFPVDGELLVRSYAKRNDGFELYGVPTHITVINGKLYVES